MKTLLTPKQLAAFEVPMATIYAWVHERKIQSIKVGKHLRFGQDEIYRHFGIQPADETCKELDGYNKTGHSSLKTERQTQGSFF